VPARLGRHLPALRLPAAAIPHDPHRRTRLRQWRKATWDEALDTIADKLKAVIKTHGGQSVALTERTNLSTHVSKTLLKAIGSPNHFTHDALCKGSVNTACRSLFGYTDAQVGSTTKTASTSSCTAATFSRPSQSKRSMASWTRLRPAPR